MAANTSFTDALAATSDVSTVYQFRRQSTSRDTVRIYVYGSWSGTVTLQTSVPGANSWIDEPSGDFTSNSAQVFEPGGNCDIRFLFTNRVSGTALVAVINE